MLAVEDSRFFQHNGIDFRAMGRVLLKSIIFGDKQSGGGSTITQRACQTTLSPSENKA
ncbi:MAG: transglycosylase domain-containing protein [Saprospiraceae bacterium]|nr:transglycosylase domain-containing protein [Saprospiraceae bacterium]